MAVGAVGVSPRRDPPFDSPIWDPPFWLLALLFVELFMGYNPQESLQKPQ